MKILVTGGAGFIGANLVRHLLKAGHKVTVLDNFSTGRREYLEELEDMLIIPGDILDKAIVQESVATSNCVIHLAAHTGVAESLDDPAYGYRVNVEGTINLLEASLHARVKRFVFASSNAVLGRQVPPATEDKAPLPVSLYGASKLAAEGYCLAYYSSRALDTIILRFSNVYGPYSDHKNSVVARFSRDMMRRGYFKISGDGMQTRDFIHVVDVCRAILAALESDIGGEVFQIGTGIETSIMELVDLFRRTTDWDSKITHTSVRPGDIRRNYSDISKAKRLLSWEPRMTLEDGLG